MSRAFQDHRGEHDLRFILFGGEEEGLFGSKRYVADLPAEERSRILAVVNMDMIGVLNAPTRSVLLEGASLSQGVIDSLGDAAMTYTQLAVETSLRPFASDHVPFIQAKIPAVLTIEGADSTNGNVHSEADTIDHVTYDFALEILRMNVAFVANEVGRAV
jgi:Zn-dependent M28 family amino/carboxypeptidase